MKLNSLYIADRKDEIEFLQWIIRVIQPILNRDHDERLQVGISKNRLEMMDVIEFENTLQERIQELNLKLQESNNLRESDILINEIDTLESILGRLSDLKYGEKNFKQAKRIRKQLVKIHDTEDDIADYLERYHELPNKRT